MEIPTKVVCDIDGVLGDVTPGIIRSINRNFGTGFTPEHWVSWDWPLEQIQLLSKMGVSEAIDWLFSNKHYSLSVPLPAAQNLLRYWADNGAEIAVATSRSPQYRDVTLEWLAFHYFFIEPANIFIRSESSLSGSAHKIGVLEKVQPDLYFEDEPAMVDKLLSTWTAAQLSRLRVINQFWNQDSQLDPFRTSWEQQLSHYK